VHVDAGTQDFLRLADGRRIEPPVASPHRVPTLDANSGTVRLCAPLTLGRHRVTDVDDFGETYNYAAIDAAAYRPPWLLTVHRGRALLRHCGSRAVRDLGPADDDLGTPVVTSRFVAWRSAGAYRVHRLADHATWVYSLPLIFGDRDYGSQPQLHATDHRLWIGDGAGNAFLIQP
jgi:hypothetical protein